MKPTKEQVTIGELAISGHNLIIEAGAGCAKVQPYVT